VVVEAAAVVVEEMVAVTVAVAMKSLPMTVPM
jgi:hypothetical protein